jgi:hypothetical protein
MKSVRGGQAWREKSSAIAKERSWRVVLALFSLVSSALSADQSRGSAPSSSVLFVETSFHFSTFIDVAH